MVRGCTLDHQQEKARHLDCSNFHTRISDNNHRGVGKHYNIDILEFLDNLQLTETQSNL